MEMTLEQKIKLMAESKRFSVTRLTHIGGSHGIILPKSWVESNIIKIDDSYYLTLEVVNNTLVFSPLQPDFLDSVRIRLKPKKKSTRRGENEDDAKPRTY